MGRLLIAALFACLAAVSPTQAEPLTGAGSTFVFPLLSRWSQNFQASEENGGYVAALPNRPAAPEGGLGSLFGVMAGGIDYEPVGSLGGTMRVIARAVDFGASERPMPAEEVDRHGLMQFPITTGGIAVVFNLPGIESGALRLSGAVLADIYMGTVDRWSHPALRALNPELTLPDAPIKVVHRSDGSGTTYNFAAYLAHASTDWRERVGIDTELKWPVGAGVRGSGGIVEAVSDDPNSIGYVELGQALRVGLPSALVENRAGQFRAPSRRSIAAAVAGADWAGSRHFSLLLTETADAEAYPIAATVYALMPREPRSGTDRTLRFFGGALAHWQQDAVDLDYVPLPDSLVGQIKSYWEASSK
ncbi:phosphate ABC transporter substrate-binding protein PstS (plasmid) [Skermanella rosea]|uniref:phosphate ABC transporter substrate-binding protein PstS n=1 Tax=Skermanella rosea TaxID=1817965 RepID=UPI0019346DEB|nr:phosphate ABC transporter substrate-binding protein PstS [Skermanella rosea]UEM07291.1 phosphate ABC transporter substrate-binding protein PstS [Skermanella rosea]